MKLYACDIPAFVTVRFAARDDAHAKEIIAQLSDTGHEFETPEGRDGLTDVDGVTISPAITLYPEGIDGTAYSPTRLYLQDTPQEVETGD